jgi:hypothetical protein
MNEPTPAPAIDAVSAFHAAPSAPEEVVHPSVPPAPPIASHVASDVPPELVSASSLASSEDQLPTSRFPSLPHALPPPMPPPGPAHKTQPLRPITREDAAAKLAADAKAAKRAKRQRLQAAATNVTRAALGVPSRLSQLGLSHAASWTPKRAGVACATVGVAMITGALVLGWRSVAGDHLEQPEHVSLAVAIVLARAALAIAAMGVGYGLLRVGERTLVSARSAPRALAERGDGE